MYKTVADLYLDIAVMADFNEQTYQKNKMMQLSHISNKKLGWLILSPLNSAKNSRTRLECIFCHNLYFLTRLSPRKRGVTTVSPFDTNIKIW